MAPDDVAQRRRVKRAELGLNDDEKMLLMVGSGFVKKGSLGLCILSGLCHGLSVGKSGFS